MKAYGAVFRTDDPVEVELEAIRAGGRWMTRGQRCGEGLLAHHKRLQSLLYPWKVWDRWSELILRRLLEKKMVFLSGPNDSSKSHSVAAYALSLYMCWPYETSILVSSTDSRSLDLRIFGELKKLWNAARAVYAATPGRMIESKQMLVTESEEWGDATDFRNGIIGIPCVVGGSYVGLGKFVGIKNKRVFLAGDELQFMSQAFFDGVANMMKRPGFRGAGMFNPKDRTDVAGKFSEPSTDAGGWEGYEPTGKTLEWPTRFPGGWCVQLDGRDTPNNETAPGQPPLYPHLITREKIIESVEFYGEDSYQVSMSCYGVFPRDALARRVITRSMCERFKAAEEPFWSGDELTRLFALDAAYGAVGGDRCVGVELAFGKCTDGVVRLAFAGPPLIIPVKAGVQRDGVPFLPEDQIAEWVKSYCEDDRRQIPPTHVAFDSTGRGSLMSAFARLEPPTHEPDQQWGGAVTVEFGGAASERMVSAKQQVPCRAYYFNMVSQLWFDTATLIESDQLRALPRSVMEEGCMRGWDVVKGKKLQVWPKSPTTANDNNNAAGFRMKMPRSPDLYDAFTVAVALAQRLGLTLGHAGSKSAAQAPNWLLELQAAQQRVNSRKQLTYR